ncbi:PREDICTED: RING-H2 finger protein ATL79-like [Ipomoea nil]|uniref:RING-H2 finger protein ATL79-like n=1 Tax=Ipomoea nil TaxID=35883 RepID=UPI000901B31E|nr:PREDICTED: RING-H2 finger protein ATL79-like [Ipomoea nil]
MRLLKEEAAEYDADFRHSPPVSPSTAAAEAADPPLAQNCFPHSGCPWWPYSSARDFKTNTVLVLLVLFSAFVCALAFNAAVRYLLRRRRRRHRRSSPPTHDDDDKAAGGSKTAEDEEAGAAIPTVIFSAAAAGVASEECIICLGEFVEGERVRVLENCKHCFHIRCIQRWLKAHSSCPTCRAASH